MVMQSVARFGALLSLILSKDQSTLRNAVHTVPALIPQAYLAHARLEALSRCPDLARIEDVVEAIDFVQNHSNPAEQSEIDVGRCASLLGSFLKRYQYERHEHAMPQKLVDDSFLILTAKRYLGTSSPALAQADLELVGAILALLYLCVVDEQKDKVLARLFEWSQSVRLSLDDLSVSLRRLVFLVHFISCASCRTSQHDTQPYFLSTTSKPGSESLSLNAFVPD